MSEADHIGLGRITVTDKAKIKKIRVDSEILPKDDDAVDLGSSTREFKDAYVDGVVYVDSMVHQGGVFDAAVVSKTGAYTVTSADHIILLDSSGGAFTVTLPAAAGVSGMVVTFKKVDVSINAITIDGNAAETIDGAATNAEMDAQYDMLTLLCDGSNWHIIGRWIH